MCRGTQDSSFDDRRSYCLCAEVHGTVRETQEAVSEKPRQKRTTEKLPIEGIHGAIFCRAETCSFAFGHETVSIPHFPTGTRRFNSSNQFSTTLICVGASSACSTNLSMRKRWPSA